MDSPDNKASWLALLESRHPTEIELGLDRIRKVADKMNLQPESSRVITVAGTNGKGSTCTLLESMYLSAGYKTGRYASPHLIEFNERIQLSGHDVEDELLITAFSEVEKFRGDISLTYFEFTTLAAFWCFQHHGADVWIVEVGLGGRLDATNILDADVAVVTSIALDHQDWLGADLEIIGREKAGIFRPDAYAVCSEIDNNQGVIQVAEEQGCQIYIREQQYILQINKADWYWQGMDRLQNTLSFDHLHLPTLPLVNAAAAIQAIILADLPVTESAINEGLATATLPGRLQTLTRQGTEYIVDVAHNPHAAKYVVQELKRRSIQPDTMIVGMLADKDVAGTLTELGQLQCTNIYLVSLDVHRGQKASQMAEYITKDLPVSLFDSVEDAIKQASHPESTVLICGSFVTVGKSLLILKGY